MNDNKVVLIGMFDGVHIGHLQLINTAKSKAGFGETIAYTFSNHPRSLFGESFKMLMTPNEKEKALKESGIDQVEMVEFTQGFSAIHFQDFLDSLIQKYHMNAIVCGWDFKFGKGGMGTANKLEQMAATKESGFDAIVVAPVMFEGYPVSSSRIREAILAGQIQAANMMLYREYSIDCILREGKLVDASETKLWPKEGKYEVRIGKEVYYAYVEKESIALERSPDLSSVEHCNVAFRRKM